MLDNSFKRNVSLEKKRLFIYSLATPLLFVSHNDLLDSIQHNSVLWSFSAIVSIISIAVISIGLSLIWMPAFKNAELKRLKKAVAAMSNISNYTILDNELKIKKSHESLQGEYLNCSIDSFSCFLLKEPLNELPKIQWINGSEKKNTKSSKANQTTLIVFICKLFPNKKDDNKFIAQTIKDFFCDIDRQEILIKDSAISQSKKIVDDIESASSNVKKLIHSIDKSLKNNIQ